MNGVDEHQLTAARVEGRRIRFERPPSSGIWRSASTLAFLRASVAAARFSAIVVAMACARRDTTSSGGSSVR